MIKISRSILYAVSLLFAFFVFSEDSELSEENLALIQRARNSPSSESWAKLSGKITHKKKDKSTEEYSIYLGIRFTPQMIFAQIVIDNVEVYTVSQEFSASNPTIIKEGDSSSRILEQIGIRPEELTLSFLYWNVKRFIGDKTFKTSKCAEFEMLNKLQNERAVVLINREYAFPLRVEWFKGEELSAYRNMEVSSFKKENDYWFVDEILCSGPGWRTKVVFSDSKAGSAHDGVPSDLFRKTFPIE